MSDAATPAPAKSNGPAKLAITLTVFATISALLLAMGDQRTRPEIELRMAEDLQAILSQVVPANLHDNDLTQDTVDLDGPNGEPITAYRAKSQGAVVAVALPVTTFEGYSGKIELVMGVNAHGEVLGVRVLSHAETPGLGDKIEDKKDDWILGFNGLSYAVLDRDKWKVKKDGGVFDQFSGATISPRAVVKAVAKGLDFVNNTPQLFAPDPQTGERHD